MAAKKETKKEAKKAEPVAMVLVKRYDPVTQKRYNKEVPRAEYEENSIGPFADVLVE
tara:strand:- start:1240 stop:1410 length:171 start_codon:yes stop_codon:yes gene_type:complete